MYFIKILCDGDLFSSIQIIILFRYRNKVKITLNILLFYVKRCDKISTLIKNNYYSCNSFLEKYFISRFYLCLNLRIMNYSLKCRKHETRPQIKQGYPLNLSILISGGKETNQDSPSNGE